MRPPRFAERLLVLRLAADEQDELVGDLNEQFVTLTAERGASAARRWYWRQALALLWGFSMQRRDLISMNHERVRGRWAAGNLALDARYAWRALRHSPSFTIIAVVMLTSGIGLSTAVFSLVNGILLEPLPYPHAQRLVRISEQRSGSSPTLRSGYISDVGLGGWMSMTTALSHLSPYTTHDTICSLPDGSGSLAVADTGDQFFTIFATRPVAGRLLLPADGDPSAPPTAVISERLAWRSYGGPQAALGQPIGLEVLTHTIIGVVPQSFAFPAADVDVWTLGRQYRRLPKPGERRQMGMSTQVAGLLRDGATIADAQVSGNHVADALAFEDPGYLDGTAEMTSFKVTRLLDDVVQPVKPALLVLGAGMSLVMLALCVTLANLLLTRNTARQRELAVRVALGANRWRIGRPVLLELLMLAAAGGTGGTLLAWWLLRGLPAIAPADLPRIESISFDLTSLTFGIGATLTTALVVGWLPLVQMGRVNVSELTASGARIRLGRLRGSAEMLRGALVVAQVGVAVALLVGALLIGRSLTLLLDVNMGYRPDGVLTFRVAQSFTASREPGRLRSYYGRLLETLQAHPAVESVGAAAVLPMHQIRTRSTVAIVGRPVERARSVDDMAVNQPVTTDYLRTIGTRVVNGRGFTADDRPGSEPVALIDEVLAGRFFPAGDAVGHQLSYARKTWTIIGVVEAMRIGQLGEDPLPVIYFNAEQMTEYLAYAGAGVAVKARDDVRALEAIVKDVARQIDPRVPLYDVRPLSEVVRGSVAQPRFFTIVLGCFALLALSTALLGIYGVLAYAVERRRLELGIRRALGATEQHIVGLVMRRGAILSVIGLVAGLTAAGSGARYMRSVLFGVTPTDLATYVVASALVLVVVLLASWQPVRQALKIDPSRALRVE